MSFFDIKGVNQSGNSCRGLILYKGGQYYLVYKQEHKPDDPFLEPPLKDFRPNSSTGDQFVEGLDDGTIERLYSYVNDHPSCVSPTDMMDTIAVSLEMSSLLVSQIRVFNNPAVKKLQEVKSSVLVLSKKVTENDLPDKVQLIPVRYALDEFQLVLQKGDTEYSFKVNEEKIKGVHELPGVGRFTGGYFKKSLSESAYTLRQLNSGWLYVWDNINQTLKEYQVSGNEFVQYDLSSGVTDKSTVGRGNAQKPKSYLEYPKNAELSLMYSPIRWSWRLLKAFSGNTSDDIKYRLKLGARKVTCSTISEEHTGLATEVLPLVADIGAEEKAIFPLAIPSITDRKAEGVETVLGQPIKTVSSFLDSVPDKPTTRVVALDNIWSDINDMASSLGYLQSLLYEQQEGEMEWRVTASAVATFCGGDLDDDILPNHIKNDKAKVVKFERDLIEYFKILEIDNFNNAIITLSNESTNLYGYSMEQSESDILESLFKTNYFREEDFPELKSTSQKEKAFDKKYLNNSATFKRWSQDKERRRYISKDTATQELQGHLQHDEALMALIQPRVTELYKSHLSIPAESPMRLGMDVQESSNHPVVKNWMTNSFDVLLPYLDEKQRENLKKQGEMNKPPALINVAYIGFDQGLHGEVQTLIKSVTYFVSVGANVFSRADEVMSSIKDATILTADWAKSLTPRAFSVLNAMRASNIAIKSIGEPFLQALTVAGGVSGQLSIEKGLASFLLEEFMDKDTSKAIRLNPDAGEEYRNWRATQKELKKEVKLHELEKQEITRKYKATILNQKNRFDNQSYTRQGDKKAKKLHKSTLFKYNNDIRIVETKINKAEIDFHDYTRNNAPKFFTTEGMDKVTDAVKDVAANPSDTKLFDVAAKGVKITVIILNLVNVALLFADKGNEDIDHSSISENNKDNLAITSAVAYLALAMSALFSSSVDQFMDLVVSTSDEKNFYKVQGVTSTGDKAIMRLSEADAKKFFNKTNASNSKKLTDLLSKTKTFFKVTGALMIIASATELYPLLFETFGRKSNRLNTFEKSLSVIKVTSLAAGTVAGALTYLTGASTLLAGFVWLGPLIAVAGVAYLVSSIALDYFMRDEVQTWLDNCRYGESPLGWSIQEEFDQLMFITYTPTVFVKPTSILVPRDDKRGQMGRTRFVSTGYNVLITLPDSECIMEVIQYEGVIWNTQYDNHALSLSPAIWLNDSEYKALTDEGLSDVMTLPSKVNPSNARKTKYCFIALPFSNWADTSKDTSKDEFILKIITSNGRKCWEYKIEMYTRAEGRIIEPDFKDDEIWWDSDIVPILI